MGTFSVRKTTDQFIAEAKAIHGDKYDYSKVQYKTNKDKVCIICPTHGDFWQRPNEHLNRKSECPHCSRFTANSKRNNTKSDLYSRWCCMRVRCSEKGWANKYKTYKGCSICEEWMLFDNFRLWAENPVNGYMIGYQIDKDLLFKGNKIYSPNTCCFIPPEINNVLTNCRKARGKYPVGVTKNRKLFAAHISIHSKQKCIGTFKSPEEAFFAYKNFKERYIKDVAEKYFQEGKITKRVYDALLKYEVDITD